MPHVKMEQYGAGDLILVTQPWIWCLTDAKLNELCSHCLHELPTVRERGVALPAIICTGCNVVQFCCTQCQMDANNSYHMDECMYVKRLSRLPGLTCVTTATNTTTTMAGDDTYFYVSRLMLRMIFRILHNDTFSTHEFFEDDRFNRDFLKTLVSHWDNHVRQDFQHQRIIGRLLWAMKSAFDITLSDADRRVETDMLHCAKRQTGESASTRVADIITEVRTEEIVVTAPPNKNQNELTAVDRQRLQEMLTFDVFGPLYARVSINSIAIQTMEFEKLGGAVYLSASVFDHSCAPNASRCFNGRELVVRATQSIRSAEDVRIAYVDVLQPTWKRKAALKRHYYFDCTCARCTTAEDEQLLYAVKCPFAARRGGGIEAADSTTSTESINSRPAGDQCQDGEFALLRRSDEFTSPNPTPSSNAVVASKSAAAAAVKRKADLSIETTSMLSARSSISAAPSTTAGSMEDSNVICPSCEQHIPFRYIQRVLTLCNICQKVMLAYDAASRRCAEQQQKASVELSGGGPPPSISACFDSVNQQATHMQRVVEQAERYLGSHHEVLLELRERLAAYCMHRGQFDKAYVYFSKTLPTIARVLDRNTITHEYATQLMRTATAAYRSTKSPDITAGHALRLAVKSLELQALLFGADSNWFKEWAQACLSMESRLRATGETSPLIHPASLISAALGDQSLRAAAYSKAQKHRDSRTNGNDDTVFIEQLLAVKDSQHAEELVKQEKAAALAVSMAAAAAAAAAERWVRTTANRNIDVKESEDSVCSMSVFSCESKLAPEPTMRPFSSRTKKSVVNPTKNSSTALRRQQQLFATRTFANNPLQLNRTGSSSLRTSLSNNAVPSVAALKIMKKASTRLPDVREEQQHQLLSTQRVNNKNLRRRAEQKQETNDGDSPADDTLINIPLVVGGGGDGEHVVADLMDELHITWANSVESFRIKDAIRGLAAANIPESVAESSTAEWLRKMPEELDQLSLSQATPSDIDSVL